VGAGSVEVRQSARGQRGLFALRPFAPGQRILVETALLWQLTPAAPSSGPSSSSSSEQPLLAPRHVPDELDAVLLQLAPFHGSREAAGSLLPEPLLRGSLAQQVLASNSFGCGAAAESSSAGAFGQGSAARAIFPVLAMLNHDCSPNARVLQVEPLAFSEEEPPQRALEARSAIAAGEELCIAYVPVTWAKRVRAERLQSSWGFACSCARCSAGHDDTVCVRCAACSRGRLFLGASSCADCSAPAPPAGGAGSAEAAEGSAVLEALCAPATPRQLVQRLSQSSCPAPEDVRVFLTMCDLQPRLAPLPALQAELTAAAAAAAQRMPFVRLEEHLELQEEEGGAGGGSSLS
jgi:hypothetical protein